MSLPRLAVLISGTGRNLKAILDATHAGLIAAEPALVLSSKADAAGLAHALDYGIPTLVLEPGAYPDREAYDAALAAALEHRCADLIALAGFMRILTPEFVRRLRGRLFNIHPSLLPKYPGLRTHARALAAGDAEHGASVHYVTEELDGGPVILRGSTPVQPGDTVETLGERVMQEIELKIYPQALAWAASGRLQLTGTNTVLLDGRELTAPLMLQSGPAS